MNVQIISIGLLFACLWFALRRQHTKHTQASLPRELLYRFASHSLLFLMAGLAIKFLLI